MQLMTLGELFWLGPMELQDGAVVLPGNWGRLVRTAGRHHHLAHREAVWELARRDMAPETPSRYDAIFLCEDEAALHQFQQEQGRSLDVPYRVRIAADAGVVHRADMTYINQYNDLQIQPGVVLQDRYLGLARSYWLGEMSLDPRPEIVVASPIEVLARLA